MKQDFMFPIIVGKGNKDTVVRFVDFDVQDQIYCDDTDYITEAKKIIAEKLLEYQHQKITIPIPKRPDDIKVNENEHIMFLNIWLPLYRLENEIYVKKTLTIPDWIDELAKKENMNFSHILTEALLVELELREDIKKLRSFTKFNEPMKNVENFLTISKKIMSQNKTDDMKISENKENDVRLIISSLDFKDFNLTVAVFTIWINKNLSEFCQKNQYENTQRNQLNSSKQKWIDNSEIFKEEFLKEINLACSNIEIYLKKQRYYTQETITEFITYIHRFSRFLLSGALKYDGSFEREEVIYDCMRAITDLTKLEKYIGKKYQAEYKKCYDFTLKHKIEIPHLYILAWNIKYLYQGELTNGYNNSLDSILLKKGELSLCYSSLKHISRTMLEILIGNPIFSDQLEPEELLKEKDSKRIISIRKKNFDFKGFLPYVSCNDGEVRDYIDIKNTIISQDVLSQVPLVPANINISVNITKQNNMALKHLVRSLCIDLEIR